MNNYIAIYQSGEIEVEVSIENETVWLSRQQLSSLFDRDIKTIGKHITNVFKEKELEKDTTVAKFATVQNEGGREVTREIEYYNLDVIISVGYRVKSQKGVAFRQWATSILKSYITNGYAINSDKITNERFVSLENDVAQLKERVGSISTLLEDTSLSPAQGIFYDGQVFDAYVFISKLIKRAKHSIRLIDNYIDESILTLFSKNQNIQITIYTKNITKQLKLDLKKYNSQYRPIEVKKFDVSHDRFLILDDTEIYHIGASLKDLGKKWFAFSKMDSESLGILERLR
jgi:hypothetical protein